MPSLPSFDAATNKCENPHVVILGAGASIAACPSGDKNGKILPSLQNLETVVGIEHITAEIESSVGTLGAGFEEKYSNLITIGSHKQEIQEINDKIHYYFSQLELPDSLTVYDYLILGLREKDAIFTFNWDPFLLQALLRCSGVTKPPNIFFLHGNVSVGVCQGCKVKGNAGQSCGRCSSPLTNTDLLFPVKQKNYNASGFLINEWNALRDYLKYAYFVTIFGYRAPFTDVEARQIFIDSFGINSSREFAEVEIIDIRERKDIEDSWDQFVFEQHYSVWDNITGSQIYKHFRRSCDAFAMASLQCHPVPEFAPDGISSVSDLREFARKLYAEENSGDKLWKDHKNPFGP
ncbi:MAG: hypothetical protein ISS68_09755 [Desulfobacteraceae bacterium]|nr:hypothetical protein [Desulfobacteraceae bacterium]MBL7173109.1 hypothetical protein [Desulfobacteraceae bacterium]